MNKAVQTYLVKKTEEQFIKEEKEKSELLVKIGLFEKEYTDKVKYSDEFPFSEYDKDTKTTRYYRKKAIEVSDEEYAEILKYQTEPKKEKKENTVATIFKFFAGIIFLIGFALGIGLSTDALGNFHILSALVYWVAFFVAGMIYYGFAEIISLLNDIKNK